MVEIRLESIEEGGSVPQDCYVSLRVGETQKLSKLAPSRIYRFPQAGEQRYGKVEIFRRVGTCSIDVDPANPGLREVRINSGEAGFGVLGLKFAVEAEEAAKKAVAPEDKDENKKVSSKVKAAKDYLSKHGLEVRLSEAMQTVLRERPDDPAEFLAKLLLGSSPDSCGGLKLPAVACRAQPGGSMPDSPMSATKVVARPHKPDAVQKVGASDPRPASLTPFKVYYTQTFDLATDSALRKLYGRFPTKAPAKKVKAMPAAVAPFGSYYTKTFNSIGDEAFTHIHSKFAAFREASSKATPLPAKVQQPLDSVPMQLKPSVGTWLMSLPKSANGQKVSASTAAAAAAPASATASAKGSFALLPSVGTWLLPRPFEALQSTAPSVAGARGARLEEQEAPPVSGFAKKPSVGTWLIARLEEPEVSAKSASAAAVSAAAPAAAAPVQQNWTLKPSIGTWLMPAPKARPAAIQQQTPWTLKPSVGTWLCPRLDAQASVDLADIKKQAAKLLVEAAESGALAQALASVAQPSKVTEAPVLTKRPLMVNTALLYGASLAGMGLRPGIRLL